MVGTGIEIAVRLPGCPGNRNDYFPQVGISQVTVNLPAEGAWLAHLKSTDNSILGARGNLDRGLRLRTEAGVHPSAIRQPDDLHHLVRRIGQREDDFLFLPRLRFDFPLNILNRTKRRRQRIVVEPTP